MTGDDPYGVELPNIRSMIVPDRGYVLVEADLARADAQVCAWDAGCAALKVAFARGDDIHSDNARWMYGQQIAPRSLHVNGMSFRDNGKRAVHLTDYAGGYRTLAASCALAERRAAEFIHYWSRELHPEIGAWHDDWTDRMRGRRMVVATNKFGFRRIYTDRTDRLLGQVLAWICQSTVSVVINKAMKRIDCAEDIMGRPRCGGCVVCNLRNSDDLHILLQVHDSVLMQIREQRVAEIIPLVLEAMQVTVPYTDPLVIATEIKFSPRHWGDMHEWKEAA